MEFENEVTLVMDAKSQNEAFARLAVSAFVTPADPTLTELTDIKTAVSEAITNAILHGYENGEGKIRMTLRLWQKKLFVEIQDQGVGIENIAEAMTPLYTSKPELERSGLGFTVMESFMDRLHVESDREKGTTVWMEKQMDGVPEGLEKSNIPGENG